MVIITSSYLYRIASRGLSEKSTLLVASCSARRMTIMASNSNVHGPINNNDGEKQFRCNSMLRQRQPQQRLKQIQQYSSFRRSLSSEAVAANVKQEEGSTSESSSHGTSSSNKSNDPPPIIWMTHRLSTEQIAKVDSIFHKILWLDMFETHMLTELINEKLNRVKLTPQQRKALERQMDARVAAREGASDAVSSSAEQEKPAEEAKPKLVDLKIIGYDEKSKIKVIKEVRTVVDGLGLKEAKELVEGVPKVIHKGIKPEVAEEFKKKLEAAGAKIEIS